MEPGVSLRPYQIADLAFHIANPKSLNLSEPSTGKTPTLCALTQYIWQEHATKAAWAQPKSLMKKNRDELLRFTDFAPEEVVIVDGTPKQVVEQCKNPDAKVFVMGFDRYSQIHELLPTRALIADEIHKGWGGDKSKRTLGFYEANRKNHWFIGMTGTLVNGRLDSAYPAIHAIEPRYYPSYESFIWYHAVKDLDNKIIGWKNTHKLSKILGRHGIRHTFEEVYGKQAKVIITEPVHLSERHRALYDKFEADAILELDKFFIDGTEPGVGFIRARQIMEHPNQFPDLTNPGHWTDILSDEIPGKEERLELHLTDHVRTGKPLVVFSSMVPQQERILKMMRSMGIKAELLNGRVPAKKRAEIDVSFREGELQMLVCSPEVADVGFNWQFWGTEEVDHVIFMTLNFMDTTFLQAFRRFIRGLRKKALLITIMEYQNCPVEQRIFEIVRRKSVLGNQVDSSRPIFDLSINEKEAA